MMNETSKSDAENLQENDIRVPFKEIFTFSNFEMMMREIKDLKAKVAEHEIKLQ